MCSARLVYIPPPPTPPPPPSPRIAGDVRVTEINMKKKQIVVKHLKNGL